MPVSKPQYRVVDSAESLPQLETAQMLSNDEPDPGSHSRIARLSRTYMIVFFSLSLGLVLGAVSTLVLGSRSTTMLRYINDIDDASPVTPDVQLSFHLNRFNGSLLKETIYRQEASEEVDAAWKALGVDYRSVIVPADAASKAGIALDQVKVSSKYGGGYVANVEGLHQLHCLNLLRQALWFNYDYYHERGEGAFRNNDFVLQRHVTHCLDIIRQQLMCTVDIGVLGQVWWKGSHMEYPEAFVDFNTRHVCRNFEDIRAWAEKHQVPAEPPRDFLEPPQPGDRIYDHIP